ncbi:MAG: M28 family peptidase [Bacteroidetes bacterium]|nr:M28 family peptidase [Bacteroidota bacterium]
MIKIKNLFLLFLMLSVGFTAQSQELNYAKILIDTLSSPSFHGRGYVNEGDRKAAVFIKKEFIKAGLKTMDTSYFQFFSLPVNTYPGKMEVMLKKKKLKPGADFVVAPFSPADSGTYKLLWFDQSILQNKKKFEAFKNADVRNTYIVLDDKGVESREEKEIFRELERNPLRAKGIIKLTGSKFTWSVSRKQGSYVLLEMQRDAIVSNAKQIYLHIEAKFLPNYSSQNVIGYIPGTIQPDSFIVFTAHYDHLGRMGSNAYFPGANDNASGTAMIIDFANHYNSNPSPYSIVFIAFAAEEAGLVGSEFYTQNPLFPLGNIRFLINLDLMGNGQEGITVVNGSVFQQEFQLLKTINAQNNHVVAINERGKAANSDHYHFSEKGVPAFFIYSLGGGQAYHDIYDTPNQIELYAYEEIFRLLTNFTSTLTGGAERK